MSKKFIGLRSSPPFRPFPRSASPSASAFRFSSIILEKRGIPSSLIGLNTAMMGVAAMIAALITTKLAHRFGVVQTMIWAVVLSALSSLGFYYAESLLLWFPLRLIFHGATHHPVHPVGILDQCGLPALQARLRSRSLFHSFLAWLRGRSPAFLAGRQRGADALRHRRLHHSGGDHSDLHRPQREPHRRRKAGTAFHPLCLPGAHCHGRGLRVRRRDRRWRVIVHQLCDSSGFQQIAGRTAADRDGRR